MKNKPVIITMLGCFLLTFVAVSNVGAEEMTWVNTYEFIAGENVMLSHSSPADYPGSITVQLIGTDPMPGETMPGEIIKRFKMREDSNLSFISICFREFDDALSPFQARIFKLAVPTDEGTVGTDELLYGPELVTVEKECTEIPIVEAIQPTDETLLLSITFDFDSSTPAAIISAVGLGQTSIYLMIDGCNTYVPDIFFDDGQQLSEKIDECAVEAKNHGKFVSCVSKIANVLKKEGTISGKEKGQITKCAAKSSLPN